MKDIRSLVFTIGLLSVLGAIVTRFFLRDLPGVPKPGAFLGFADTCFLLVIAVALMEILNAIRGRAEDTGEAKEAQTKESEGEEAETDETPEES